ncbi:MAG: phosphate ABC transporter ATP-binding protein [Acidimicrobiales bacterium]|nr:phosphate ABC transporter ATP-binding protein [Acidimicrobiales bacterium]MBO0893912.1 phosphate ABC transporter ATP-binding protein [Acidimicrobiales bacterium]
MSANEFPVTAGASANGTHPVATETVADPAIAPRPKTMDQVVDALDPDRERPSDVLRAQQLTLRIGQKVILKDIDIRFRSGSITAVIGPTGTGKSMFLRTLNRMNDRLSGFSREGDVTLDGTSIWAAGLDLLALRRRVGMLFQRPNPFPMSIKDNVVAGVRAHRIAKGKQLDVIAEQRLREVGLWDAVKDRLGESPFRLSGGQQQLLCLARALAVGPDILLLDEPTSSLDPLSTERIEEMLRALVPALTLLVVTHNLGQARRLSHETMFLYEGHLTEHGRTDELFQNPREQDTANYVTGRIG